MHFCGPSWRRKQQGIGKYCSLHPLSPTRSSESRKGRHEPRVQTAGYDVYSNNSTRCSDNKQSDIHPVCSFWPEHTIGECYSHLVKSASTPYPGPASSHPSLAFVDSVFFFKKHCHETGVGWVAVHQLQRKQIKEQGTISHLKCQAAKSVFKHCNRLWGQEVCSPCQPCESSSLWQQLQETQTAREKVKSSKCFSLEFSQTD